MASPATALSIAGAYSSAPPEAALAACDGVADEVELQAALNALQGLADGGELHIAGGIYNLAGGLTITANKRLRVIAHGATFRLASGVTGLTINQGVVAARGVSIEGLRVDGQNNASTTGVLLKDTNNAALLLPTVENCATGIELRSDAVNGFVEGTTILGALLRANTTAGIALRTVSGTGSFAQTVITGLKCVVGGTGIGFDLDNPGILQRSVLQGTFWVDTNQTAVDLDGNIEDSTLDIAVEGAGGSTGNTALNVGANATNTSQAFLKLLLTGTIANQLTTTKDLLYWSGGSQIVSSAGTAFLGFKRHGDSTDRLRFEALTAGGRIQFGSGAALDAALARVAAAIIGVTSTFEFTEIADPAAGATNTARLYAKDNGAGKTQLVVRFPTGAVQVLATEP